jgi:hypothetical protein
MAVSSISKKGCPTRKPVARGGKHRVKQRKADDRNAGEEAVAQNSWLAAPGHYAQCPIMCSNAQ